LQRLRNSLGIAALILAIEYCVNYLLQLFFWQAENA
jgi:hypothetical protein